MDLTAFAKTDRQLIGDFSSTTCIANIWYRKDPYGSFTMSVLKIMLAGTTASSRSYPSLRKKM